MALGTAARPAAAQPGGAPPIDSALVRAVDSLVVAGLARYAIAGAATAVVSARGDVRLRGHGLADVTARRPVNPARTRWHVASLTKLATAVAVLQLAERGTLSLDADVNAYLGDARLPDAFGRAVRLRDLLTHAGGLADRWTGIAARRPDEVRALGDWLRARPPRRVEPPGVAPRYSNAGYALAGLAAERAAGEPWARLVEARVLAPLGMSRSHVRPRPPDADEAVGYFYRRDTTPEPRLYEHVAPAGALHATAADMAALVGMLLGGGAWRGARVLGPAAAASMVRPQFAPDPALPAWTFALYELPRRATRALVAGGELPGFSSRVLLLPDAGLGVFVAVNRKDASLAAALFDAVVARVAGPPPPPDAPPLVTGGPPLAGLAGAYRFTLGDPSSWLRVAALFVPRAEVRPSGDTAVVVAFHGDGVPRGTGGRAWRRVGGLAFADPATGDRIAFRVAAGRGRGRGTHLFAFSPTAGPVALERVPWWEAPPVAAAGALVPAAAFALTLVALPFARRDGPRALAALVAALGLGFLAAFAWAGAELAVVHDDRFALDAPWWLRALLLVPAAWALGAAALAWRVARRPRTPYVVLVACAAVFAAWLWRWNLIIPHA